MRLLATLLSPTGGSISITGCDAAREPEKIRARIGFLSTGSVLCGWLTALGMDSYAPQATPGSH